MVAIADHLAVTASTYTQRALEAHLLDVDADFWLYAGTAIEHASKSFLANANPVFIAAERSFDSAVALDKAGNDVTRLPIGTPTVGASEALTRVSKLLPSIKSIADDCQDVFLFRNGEVHMGVGDATERRRLFISFLRLIRALWAGEPDDIWGEHRDFVQKALDERSAEIETLVAEMLAAAKTSYNARFGSLSEEYAAGLREMIVTRRDSKVDNETSLPHDCLACGTPALVLGDTVETDVEVDYDDGVPTSAWPILTFFPSGLHCEACGLTLHSPDQLSAAGVGESWRNEDIDVYEWIAENYESPGEY